MAMARVMLLFTLLASFLISCVVNSTDIHPVTISTDPDYSAGPINWQTTITVTCDWTPSGRRPGEGEVLINDVSILSDASPYVDDAWSEEPPDTLRIVFSDDPAAGKSTLIMKRITKADAGTFQCQVQRKGVSAPITIDILEPPSAGVGALTADAKFEEATVTFDAVEGATKYTVGIKAEGAADWEDVDVTEPTHTFTGLEVATTYTVRASASNDAGIRDGIDLAETTFDTKDNRPPKAVDDLSASSGGYADTNIVLTWSLQSNLDVEHLITDITATVRLVDGADIETKTLGADATTVTFDVGAAGDYEFTVTVNNEFSTGVDTSATTTFLVKPVTTPKPTTPKPTTPKPTTPKKTTPKPTTPKPTTPKATTPKATTPKAKSTTPAEQPPVDCGYNLVQEITVGEDLALTCKVPEDAGYKSTEITWSFNVKDAETMKHEDLAKQDGIEIDVGAEQTMLKISKITANQQGTYICQPANVENNCEFTVNVSEKDPTGGASVGATISSLLTLFVGLLAFY